MLNHRMFTAAASYSDAYSGPTGLTSSLLQVSGETGIWTEQTGVTISDYAGATARLVFKSVSGSDYSGDFQLDDINFDSNSYTFESDNESWQRSDTSDVGSYESVTWESISNGVGGTTYAGFWVRYSGNTPSGGTGDIGAHGGSWHIYYEASSGGAPSITAWVRSPEIVLSATPTLSFWEGRDGTTMGTLDVYLDIL